MGHHIDSEGRFQSDKYPDLAPDKIVLSFKDEAARHCLRAYAEITDDKELGEDLAARLNSIGPWWDKARGPALVIEFDGQLLMGELREIGEFINTRRWSKPVKIRVYRSVSELVESIRQAAKKVDGSSPIDCRIPPEHRSKLDLPQRNDGNNL